MDIKTTKRTLMGLPPRQSVLLEARHGVGKSEIIAQVAAEMSSRLKKPFGLIDIRLGQYEVGDLIGIPRPRDTFTVTNKVFKSGILTNEHVVAHNVTVHDLPLWFPQDPESAGYMFFDEFNRGSRETHQWAMQAVLDYRVNFVDIPSLWRVLAACNNDMDSYSVLGLDPALYDRFFVIPFQPTQKEWEDYAEQIGVHLAILAYIRKFGGTDLDPPDKIDQGKIYPSRRSWVKFSKTLEEMKANGDDPMEDHDYLYHLAHGFVGPSVGVNFKEFVAKDFQVFSAKEILANFPKLRNAFEKMIPTDYTWYNKEIVNYLAKNKVKLSKVQGTNLWSYVQLIPRDVATGFWGGFCASYREEAVKWYQSDPAITKYVRGLLNYEESMKVA